MGSSSSPQSTSPVRRFGNNIVGLLHSCMAIMNLSTPKKRTGIRPTVCGWVNGEKVHFLLDTGASVSLLSKETADRIGWEKARKIQLSPTMTISGITGHGLELMDCIEVNIKILGKTITRPMLIVDGITHCDALLGWDTISEEGITVEGKSSTAFYHQTKETDRRWDVAALVAGRRTVVEPRTVQKFHAIAMLQDSCLQQGEQGICTPLEDAEVGMWECLAKSEAGGRTTMTVINTTNRAITIKAGQQVGIMRNPEKTLETISPLDHETIASIMGEIGKDPKEPQRGQVTEISAQERADLKNRLHIKATGIWKTKLEELMIRYHDVCSKNKYDLGRADVIKHSIRMQDEVPTHSRQFRIPLQHEQYVQGYVDELLKQGAIEVSRSPYNSAIFCVAKKIPPEWPKGTPPPMRCVLDYRRINSKSLPDKYAIREIREYIDEVGRRGSAWFSALDLTSGFWQQELEEESRQYTAFTVPGRMARYQWRVTPMGLQGSPASFARLMDHIMRGIDGVLTYIDDVLIHSKGPEEHLRVLEEALLRMRKFGLKLNVDKTIIGAGEVQYLGYTVAAGGVSPSVDKLKAIRESKAPTSVKQIREFVGLTNYFRFLVPNFSRMATTLTALTKKDSKWEGGELPAAAAAAFDRLKKCLCEPPVVGYPQRDRTFILHTDGASGDAENPGGLGAVLSQEQGNGEERVIAYASRALKEHEKNYSAYLLEMAAAVFGIEHFDVYLKGKKFILYTDHRPLEKLSAVHTKTLNRLQQLMTEFTFEMRYKPGEENGPADYLSRNVVATVTDESGSAEEAQETDKTIQDLKKFIKTKKFPKGETATYQQWVRRISEQCSITDGLLWYNYERKGFRAKPLLYAPEVLRSRIIEAAHATLEAGHGGNGRTCNRILQSYWWPGMTSQVAKFVKECKVCTLSKANKDAAVPLQANDLCTQPNERVPLDLFGPLKVSEGGNKYVLVMTDAFTKLVELAAIEDKTAETVARNFFEKYICRYTAPKVIMTDQGKEFCNEVLELVCELWGIKKTRTSPFHPQTNSSAESYNRSMIKYMRAVLSNDRTTDWEMYLAPMMMSYNCHVHRATKETPFFLTFLHDPRLPVFDVEKPRKLYQDNYAADAFNLAQAAQLRVHENLGEAQRLQEEYFNKTAKEKTYNPGDIIMIHFPNVPPGVNQKFFTRWRAFTVVKMVGPVNVEAKEKNRTKSVMVHVNRTRLLMPAETASLKPYAEEDEKSDGGKLMRNSGTTGMSKDRRCDSKGQNQTKNANKNQIQSNYNLRPRGKVNLVYDQIINPTQQGEEEEDDWQVVKRRKYKSRGRAEGQSVSENTSEDYDILEEEADQSSESWESPPSRSSSHSANEEDFIVLDEKKSDNDDRRSESSEESDDDTDEPNEQERYYGGSILNPFSWDFVASSLLPSTRPMTRSGGSVPEIPLPRTCPTRKRKTGRQESQAGSK